MKRVLLSAVGGSVAVSYINHLKAKNYVVIGMDVNPECAGRFVCDEFYVAPSVNDSAYLTFLEGLDFDLFFPWLDEEHLLFAGRGLSNNLKDRVLTSPAKSIQVALDKKKTYEHAVAHNISVAALSDEVPAFVRPRFSRGSKGAGIIDSQPELIQFDEEKYIVQEVLDGTEYTVDMMLDQHGNVLCTVPRIRVKAANVSLVGQVDMSVDVISFCEKVANSLPFYGPINIQVIKCDEDIYLVEVNPRLAGTSILSIKAGFDMLDASIKLYLDGEYPENFDIKDGLRMYRNWCEIYV